MNDQLTINDVAQRLRCHRNTVVNLIRRGDFPNAWKIGRQWRVPAADVQQYIEQQRGEVVTAE